MQLMRTGALLLAFFLSSCGAATLDDGSGNPIPNSRAISDSYVTILDQNRRAPVDPSEVAILSFVGETRPIRGCTTLARLYMESTSQAQIRSTAVNWGARLGASAVIIGVAEQRTAHDAANRRGMGTSGLSTRYEIDAIDCR